MPRRRRLWFNLALAGAFVAVALMAGKTGLLGMAADPCVSGSGWVSVHSGDAGPLVIAMAGAIWLASVTLHQQRQGFFLQEGTVALSRGWRSFRQAF